MPKLEMFFDYACPYCLRGHEDLLELLPKHPGIEIEWRPCEAHPRPERHGPHSDLCARGMYFALEHGADLMEYHRRMYRAALSDRANIEDAHILSAFMDGLLDSAAFCEALLDGAYLDRLLENNRVTWGECDFPAVPSYRMDGRVLASVPGVGVSKEQLEEFLR